MHSHKMISITFVLLFAVLANANSIIRIYSNLAEIIQPLDKLPIEFSDDNWSSIRSDSITLLGEDLNITLQTITEKKKSLNGTEIYIRSPISSDKITTKLIKAILIDEINNLVKINDQSIGDGQDLYFTVPNDQIYYLEQPPKSKYYVNFTYKALDSNIFVSYLQSNIHWRTQYQLNLYDNESELLAMADIRNDGKSSVSIDQAELIGGDINLQIHQQQYGEQFRTARLSKIQMFAADSAEPVVEQGEELVGLYVFPIKKPFTIDAKTNYLLSMFKPHVSVERYGLISKVFSSVSTTGKAQRSYRLRSDRYLSDGNCFIRENDRIVGETILPNLAAKDAHEFSIGEDADIIYKENVTLVFSTTFNETESITKVSYDKDMSPVVIITRTRFVYNVDVQLKNFKTHQINIEYEQKGLQSYQKFELKKSDEYKFIQDGSSIKTNITLKGNTTKLFSYNSSISSLDNIDIQSFFSFK